MTWCGRALCTAVKSFLKVVVGLSLKLSESRSSDKLLALGRLLLGTLLGAGGCKKVWKSEKLDCLASRGDIELDDL